MAVDGITFEGLWGVVLAAGFSRRMGAFKPLLRLGDTTVVASAVGSLRDGGVRGVIVVTGHNADELRPHLEDLGVVQAHNPHHEQGMYTSVQAGVAALPPEAEAFFLLPCDIPRSGAAITRALAARRAELGDPAVVYPEHGGRRGHPPLISARLVPEILGEAPPDGLRGLLRGHATDAVEVHSADAGILRDLDTAEAYAQMLAEEA